VQQVITTFLIERIDEIKGLDLYRPKFVHVGNDIFKTVIELVGAKTTILILSPKIK